MNNDSKQKKMRRKIKKMLPLVYFVAENVSHEIKRRG